MARISHLTSDLTAAPTVVSLLDVDFYKFTMGQYAFLRHPDVSVRYRLICRAPAARLARSLPVEALRDGLEAVRALSFRREELDYLRGLPGFAFAGEYLEFLARLRLPALEVSRRGDDFWLEYEGRWPEVIHWETLVLSVLSELLGRAVLAEGGAGAVAGAEAEGSKRLEAKIATLRKNPGVRFASFGTRRRFSRAWQLRIESRLREALPEQFTGTSSVESAFRNGLDPVGTVAHEVFMVGAGLAGDSEAAIRESPTRVLEAWWEMFGPAAALVPTDTWGSGFFFRETSGIWAERLRGVRHDSGDPVAHGERALGWRAGHGLDPRDFALVFSDGLELPEILALHRRFAGRARVSFGWGTNLTNDCGLPVRSLVVKPVRAAGRPLVKLSDNPGKSTGEPEDIRRYRHIFGTPAGEATAPKY